MEIVFTDTLGVPEEYAPVPASKVIPEWYKNLESYIGGAIQVLGILTMQIVMLSFLQNL